MIRKCNIAILSMVLTLCAAVCAWGKPLLEDTYTRAEKPGRTVLGGETFTGKGNLPGWRANSGKEPGQDILLYDFLPGRDILPEKGTIEVMIQRARSGGHVQNVRTGSVYETLLDLAREDRKDALAVYIVWNDEYDITTSSVVVWGQLYGMPPEGFTLRFPLGRVVPVGESVHIAMTWGPDPEKDCRFFLNGVDVLDKSGRETLGSLPRYLAAVRWLKIGADSTEPKSWPGGRNPMYGAAIHKVAVHGEVLSKFDTSATLPAILGVTDDTFKVAGISGKLVAGDTATVTLKAAPGGRASFDMGNVRGIPMEEVPPTAGGPGSPAVDNGTYRGSYTIRPGDDFENGRIAGRFVSADNVAAEPFLSSSKWTIDTKPVVTFSIDKRDLPADSGTKARIKLVAKDANGTPVKGRHLRMTLATTGEYTGTVGAGDFGKEVGATVETRWKGETDAWGEVEFDYTAGFAAKTVLLSAKDLDSGGTAVDYITAYKEASIDIALKKVVSRAAVRRSIQYVMKVEASRAEITADGRSRSVVRATLLDPNGTSVAGDPVAFSLSSANGTLRTIQGTTDSSGVATGEYTAGTTAGIVVVTATATLRNVQGQVSIILLADAPAKVFLKARPDSLPADGVSRADIQVKVTDANDNPNRDTKVEFRVARGGGKLSYADRVTDRYGDASNVYTSGTEAGMATVQVTVRSRPPTEAELARARSVLFVPYTAGGDEVRVEKWLKKKGDTALRGEPIVEYTVGRERTIRTLVAPYDLTMGDVLVEQWDGAEVGQTLATLVPR